MPGGCASRLPVVALVVWTLVGALVGAVLWGLLGATFSQPLFARTNYRQRAVPVGAGLVLVLALVVVEAGAATIGAAGHRFAGTPQRLATLAVAVGFGLLGLLDDLAAAGDDRGFAGHLRALARGRLTTGGVKLFGGAALALGVIGALGAPSVPLLLVDGALVALAANLANLLDRAPGRVTKFAVLSFAILAVAVAGDSALIGPAVVVGAALGLLWPDLRERLMLGDAGANPLGAVLGLGVVLTTGTTVRVVVAAALLGLNLLSERVSFSAVIEAAPPLRALDRLGRRP